MELKVTTRRWAAIPNAMMKCDMIRRMDMKMTTHGRVTIPIALRRKLGITSRTHIAIEVDEDNRRIILTPITREYVHSLRGKYKGKGMLQALMAEREREREL
jgi:bifunctional DNA-binding transcriptional regulator/antitoxin component of YhaV-PrlF toxin-antitoxin module